MKLKESQPKSERRERVREFRFSTFCFYCYGIFEIVIHRVIITYEATKFIFCSFFFFISFSRFLYQFLHLFCCVVCLNVLHLFNLYVLFAILLTIVSVTHQASSSFFCYVLFVDFPFFFFFTFIFLL